MKYESLSIEELKKNYSDRPGFVFISNQPSSQESCKKLYEAIKTNEICQYEPDFINVLNNGLFHAFVYPSEVSFESSDFYTFANHVGAMLGIFKIDILAAFLKEN